MIGCRSYRMKWFPCLPFLKDLCSRQLECHASAGNSSYLRTDMHAYTPCLHTIRHDGTILARINRQWCALIALNFFPWVLDIVTSTLSYLISSYLISSFIQSLFHDLIEDPAPQILEMLIEILVGISSSSNNLILISIYLTSYLDNIICVCDLMCVCLLHHNTENQVASY